MNLDSKVRRLDRLLLIRPNMGDFRQKETTRALATVCLIEFARQNQPMIRFNIENALVVFSIFTIVKRLESAHSIFCTLRATGSNKGRSEDNRC